LGIEETLKLLGHDVAIDLGTSNTLVHAHGRGIVVDEPSMVAVRQAGAHREVVAVGAEAKQMLGRTPGSITSVRPLKDGVITDYEVTELMLRYFITRSIGKNFLWKPRIAICIPHGVTEVEKRAVLESARAAGAREVVLVQEPQAAALGAELPLSDPRGCMIFDIGGGTSEASVLSMGGVVSSRTLREGGDRMDEAISDWIRSQRNVLIGERTAEAIKLEVGCARIPQVSRSVSVKGRDLSTGIPRQFTFSTEEACEALSDCVARIVETARGTLADTPPELAADILDSGIVLCGGGSLLEGLAEMLRDLSGLPVMLAPDPMRCVVHGMAIALSDPALLERLSNEIR
jgi:rod shape-determining protein MreB and related proteins